MENKDLQNYIGGDTQPKYKPRKRKKLIRNGHIDDNIAFHESVIIDKKYEFMKQFLTSDVLTLLFTTSVFKEEVAKEVTKQVKYMTQKMVIDLNKSKERILNLEKFIGELVKNKDVTDSDVVQ